MGSRSQATRDRLTARLMRIVLLGATGMVGAGTLREALADPDVAAVLSVSRRSCGVQHPKLRELLLPDLFDFAAVERQLIGWDACVWAVGISSVGLDEPADAKVAEELTLRWARALLRLNPVFSFCYCSAAAPADRCGLASAGGWRPPSRRCRSVLGLRATRLHPTGARNPLPGEGLPGLHRVVPAAVPLLVRAAPALATTSEAWARHAAWSRARPGATSSNPRTSTASARDPLLAVPARARRAGVRESSRELCCPW